MNLPFAAQFKPAKQGGQILVTPDNHEFKKSRPAQGKKLFMKCRMHHKYGCKATAAVDLEENMVVRLSGEHNHDTDITIKKVKEMEKQAVEEAARNPTVSPRTVLGNLSTNIMGDNPNAINHLCNKDAFRKRIQRERNKLVESSEIPRTWEQMADIPDALKVTAAGEVFLICNKPLFPDGEERVVGFSSPSCLDILKSSDTFFGDGTFDVAKSTLFKQLFIVNAKTTTGITVPCAYFMLPNKEWESYQMIFKTLKEFGVPPPDYFYSDYEKGIFKGFREVYPETTLRGDDTHFKAAVRRQIQDQGLMPAYNSNESFQNFIRSFWALSLVPVDDVVEFWEQFVLPSCPDPEEWDGEADDLEDLISYLAKAWIGAKNERTGIRRNPVFRHPLWNKVAAVLNEDATTTNCCEGYNHAIKLSIPYNANIFTVIKQLKAEDALVMVKLREAAVGAGKDNSARTNFRKQRWRELKELVSNYENLSRRSYLEYMIAYYNHDLSFVG